MAEIRRLDESLRARIAAGEVIERPQSVVRELVDNAVDAGADEISLSITGGGIDSITLSDNGSGIAKDDLELSVQQYATSKISKLDDLYHLNTLGFRGEALFSIASISRLTISSSYKGTEPWTIIVDNTKKEAITKGGPDRGTIVKVEDLFKELPARRAFLKRPSSEAVLCKNTLLGKAMAFPDIHFTFIQDGVLRVDLPKRKTLFDRVMDVFTLEENFNRKEFVCLEGEYEDFKLKLVTSLAGIHRCDRSKIKIYVNNRAVDEYSLVQAIVYGYGEILPGGAFPYSALFVEDNPELVDFNIHPAKKEVKLRNKAEIHHEIHTLINKNLPRQIPSLKAEHSQGWLTSAARNRTSFEDPSLAAERIKFSPSETIEEDKEKSYSFFPSGHYKGQSKAQSQDSDTAGEKPQDNAWLTRAKEIMKERETKPYRQAQEAADEIWKPQEKPFKYLGQAFNLFLICQRDDELYLVDQHAAHERIIFNELKEQRDVQQLLIPLEFEVDSDVDAFLAEYSYIYTQYGINIAQKDDCLWELVSIPHSARENEKRLVSFIQSAKGSEEEIEAGLYAIVACKAAIKAGDELPSDSAIAILEKVFQLEDPSCPHGRTFVIRLTEKELRLMVGRTK